MKIVSLNFPVKRKPTERKKTERKPCEGDYSIISKSSGDCSIEHDTISCEDNEIIPIDFLERKNQQHNTLELNTNR